MKGQQQTKGDAKLLDEKALRDHLVEQRSGHPGLQVLVKHIKQQFFMTWVSDNELSIRKKRRRKKEKNGLASEKLEKE